MMASDLIEKFEFTVFGISLIAFFLHLWHFPSLLLAKWRALERAGHNVDRVLLGQSGGDIACLLGIEALILFGFYMGLMQP
jgi:hypothetical protein